MPAPSFIPEDYSGRDVLRLYDRIRLGLGLDKGSRIIIDRLRRGLPGFGEPFSFVNLVEAHGPFAVME